MAISPGSRVGPYEVVSQLGEGAMGVVWRARDTKLLREVALKILPDHFADDPDRLSRLQREAQLLASLNHSNIAQVYGLEHVGTGGCIVMELVEGETLADKLRHGPIPLDEAIEIAKQLADALAAAHERGIVHRDLKPANIKLSPNGTVKVLDFGLAKPLAAKSSQSGSSMLPTIASGSTAGAIVGTVAYMSPEQARGKEVDARTDIWAFGCVLYEMLTGRPAFDGETTTDMIAKVVTGQPDLDLLPPGVPQSIRFLLAATLNKNIQQRLQHIGDMRLFLDQRFFRATPAPAPTAAVAQKTRRGTWLMIALFAVTLVAVSVAVALYVRTGSSANAPMMHFEVGLPGYVAGASASPDGQRIAYIGEPPGDTRAIWIRPVGAETAQKLPGTDKPTAGLWSPDSRSIAFVAEGKLKKIDVATGSIQIIGDAGDQPRALGWSSAGAILFTKDNVLVRVPQEGGTITPVTALDSSRKESLHALPVFLPDGNRFLYAVVSSVPENAGIFVGSLDGKIKTRLRPLGARLAGLAYAPQGYVMVAGESLAAQRFDASKLRLDGATVPVVDDPVESLSVSNTGLLLYRKAATTSANKQLTWFDRTGKQLGPVGTAANYVDVELSPTGDRVAADITTNNNRDVWIIDIARAVPSRITFDQAPDWAPIWSPDGSQILFASSRNGSTHMYQKSSAGVGNEELVFKRDGTEVPGSWSHDGRYVVFSQLKGSAVARNDLWLMSMSGERKASPFLESPFDKAQARISPDGRWLAYISNDSGMYQVVVQSFPDPNGGKWQITAQGGIEPRWRRDGRELYYLGFDGKLMAVAIKADRTFEATSPVALFETPLMVSRGQLPRDRRYDVTSDGPFLIAVPAGSTAPAPVTAVVNWASSLEKQ
jgi:Tol biopolymer transport system component/tRNA A-37 threonylcarbamoyl transferase component Bud32